MINADQARQQARNSVFEQIEARAKEGYYILRLEIPMESFKEAFFRELAEKHGFSVSVEPSVFKFIICISWHRQGKGSFTFVQDDYDPYD